jgi:hypothetical protein
MSELFVFDIKVMIQELIERNREEMRKAKSAGINSPGFNQAMGAHDELVSLLDEINELENDCESG